MTLRHALLVISHGTQYVQGISAMVLGTFTVETGCWPLPFSYWLTEHSV